jgi:hypothetical protein
METRKAQSCYVRTAKMTYVSYNSDCAGFRTKITWPAHTKPRDNHILGHLNIALESTTQNLTDLPGSCIEKRSRSHCDVSCCEVPPYLSRLFLGARTRRHWPRRPGWPGLWVRRRNYPR